MVPSDVHPIARKVMDEIGIDISRQFAKYLDRFENTQFDVIITLCGDVDGQCPNWANNQRKVHIGFLDPTCATGSEEEVIQIFRMVRDGIRRQIVPYLNSFGVTS